MNNNWEDELPEVMGFVPQVSTTMFISEELPPEIVRTKRFIRYLLTKKDQEHKAELEEVKIAVKTIIDMNKIWDTKEDCFDCLDRDIEHYFDSHINN